MVAYQGGFADLTWAANERHPIVEKVFVECPAPYMMIDFHGAILHHGGK